MNINQLAEKAAEAIDIHIALNETDFKRSNLAQILLSHFTPLASELEAARRLLQSTTSALRSYSPIPYPAIVIEADTFLRTNPTKP